MNSAPLGLALVLLSTRQRSWRGLDDRPHELCRPVTGKVAERVNLFFPLPPRSLVLSSSLAPPGTAPLFLRRLRPAPPPRVARPDGDSTPVRPRLSTPSPFSSSTGSRGASTVWPRLCSHPPASRTPLLARSDSCGALPLLVVIAHGRRQTKDVADETRSIDGGGGSSSVHGGGSWSSTHASCGSSSVRRQATHPSSRVLTAAARSPSTSSSATGRGGGGIRRTSSVHGRRLLAAVELGGVDWILETCPR